MKFTTKFNIAAVQLSIGVTGCAFSLFWLCRAVSPWAFLPLAFLAIALLAIPHLLEDKSHG